jgi:hypothetical protein
MQQIPRGRRIDDDDDEDDEDGSMPVNPHNGQPASRQQQPGGGGRMNGSSGVRSLLMKETPACHFEHCRMG